MEYRSKRDNKYIDMLTAKYFDNHNEYQRYAKTASNVDTFPTIYAYKHLLVHNFSLAKLKEFAKHYKLKMTGNKQELAQRVFSYLCLSAHAVKIQTAFRGALARKYRSLHGPAARNRKLCTNADDFISMEPIEDIHLRQFISYEDADGFVYGFDISSLHNLFQKSGNQIRNPYNRQIFPANIIEDTMVLIRIGNILNVPVQLQFEDASATVSDEKAVELRAVSLFQSIDALGNYSNAAWFLSLNRSETIKFLRDLLDIWQYRAQLTHQTKCNICPPFGDPFRHLDAIRLFNETDLWKIKKTMLEIMEKLVTTGMDVDSKSLGAYYVLGALTLVSQEAATSLPWLFQSMNYF